MTLCYKTKVAMRDAHTCNPCVEQANNCSNLLLEVGCIGCLGVLPIAVGNDSVVVEQLLWHPACFVILLELLCSCIPLHNRISCMRQLGKGRSRHSGL